MSLKCHNITQIVFDFDTTLFDTEKRKEYFWRMATVHGLSIDQAKNVYLKARVRNGLINITLQTYLAELKLLLDLRGKPYQADKVAVIIKKMNKENGLVPGAKEWLEFCKKMKMKMYLLSLGVPEWQKQKVKQSGIGKYFRRNNIVYTLKIKGGKEQALRELFGHKFKGENTVLVNDKPDETGELLKKFSKLIILARRDSRDTRYTEADYVNLTKKYRGRVAWSECLPDLLNQFKLCLK